VPANRLSQGRLDEILKKSGLSQCAQQRPLDQLKQFGVSRLDVASQVPREMCHRHNGLHTLHLVVLVSLQRQLILAPRQWTNIPRDVIAPALNTTAIIFVQPAWHLLMAILHNLQQPLFDDCF